MRNQLDLMTTRLTGQQYGYTKQKRKKRRVYEDLQQGFVSTKVGSAFMRKG